MPALQKPSDLSGKQFENMCLVIFERHFEADDANFYGSNRYGQNGIDLTMANRKAGASGRVVVQCKDRPQLSWSNFSEDFKAAINKFGPRADDDPDLLYILATTAPATDTSDIDKKAKLAKEQLREKDPTLDTKRLRQEVYDAIKKGDFPKPVKLSGRSSAWIKGEVE